jgi:hypothetical protein
MELLQGVERLYVFDFSLARPWQRFCYRKSTPMWLQLSAFPTSGFKTYTTSVMYKNAGHIILNVTISVSKSSLWFSTPNHCIQSLLKVNTERVKNSGVDGISLLSGVRLSDKIGANTYILQLMPGVLHETWRRMPPDLERSRGYIEEGVADRRQGMVLQVCGWGEVLTHPTVKTLTYA